MSFNFLERGFRSKSENLALSYRNKLGLKHYSPLDAYILADHLEVNVTTPSEMGLDVESCQILTNSMSGWSALTLERENANPLIIHNPSHSSNRQQSDIMHELAHVICEHPFPPVLMVSDMPIPLRHYSQKNEEEADWLGTNILLPRKALQWCKHRKMSSMEIAEYYNVSSQLVKMRINLTGINKQFGK